jgi:chorismate lyase / 3-hydroxybenzoate synthase
VGHETRHSGSVGAQLDEILANLESLLAHARLAAPGLPPRFDGDTLIKVYLRHAEHLAVIEGALRRLLPAGRPLLVLQGDVCRADLLVELEAVHFSSGG